MEDTEEYKLRLAFLLDSLPSLNKSSKIIKNRICRSFREQSFPAGHVMFREGDFIKNGYLIKRGEVELYSRRNLRLINYINTLKEERKIDQD
jgi:CRP-like cAMP-binding protein